MNGEFEQYKKDVGEEGEVDFQKTLNEIIDKVLEQGQLIVVANKQMGKTNSAMWLVRTLMKKKEHEEGKFKTLIFDLPMVWRYKFDKIPYVDHAKISYLPTCRDLIIDLPYVDGIRTRNAIGEIMMEDFVRKRMLKEKFGGRIPFQNVYVVEEMQNIWGTYALNGRVGRFALKIFSECANYGMIIIGITQRLADVSTKIIGRARYLLIGSLTEDNDIRKISRLASKQVAEKVKTLKRGQFLFWDRQIPEYIYQIDFPKFENNGENPFPLENGHDGKGHVKKVFLV